MSDFSALLNAAVEQAKAAIATNNALAAQIKSAGNAAALVADIRDVQETQDATVLEYRSFMDKANAAILDAQSKVEAWIKSPESGLMPVDNLDVEKATADWKAQNEIVKALKQVLKTVPKGDDALKDLPEVVGIPGTRSGGTGNATGIRRPRFQKVSFTLAGSEDWKDAEKTDDEGKSVTNLSVLATILNSENKDAKNVSASDLQEALFAEAKTTDLSTLDGSPITFAFGVGDKNYLIRVTPPAKSAE